MTEKVKLTQEQAEAIKEIKKLGSQAMLLTMKVQKDIVSAEYEFVHDMTVHNLARVLFEPDSYEVKPMFKIGDWVARVSGERFMKNEITMQVMAVDNFIRFEVARSLHRNQIRHATPEEIKAEQERRLWAKLGREIGEFRDGDVVKAEETVFEVGEVAEIDDERFDIFQWHKQGRIKGFYPGESFVSFEEGES